MGPGLSNVNKRMFDALSKPITGHLHLDFLGIMDVTIQMLREVFMTSNKLINPDIHHRKLRHGRVIILRWKIKNLVLIYLPRKDSDCLCWSP